MAPSLADRAIQKWLTGLGMWATHWFVAPMSAGIAIGMFTVLAGTFLLAFALPRLDSAGPDWRDSSQAAPGPLTAPGRSDVVSLGVAAAGVAAVVGLFLGGRWGAGLAIAWVVALGAAAVYCEGIDRRRGARFGRMFAGAREISGLIILMALASFSVAHDLTSWRWAATPDEICFFDFAKQPKFDSLPPRWFSEEGLWRYHPVLSHYYQALFLRTLGAGIFSWRLSSVLAFALSLPFLYLLVRELWGRWAAWLAAIFLAFAPPVLAFAHLGYTNIQSLVFLTAALGIFARAMRRKSALGYFLAGTVTGLGFYTFYTARLTVPLVLILGLSAGALSLRGAARARTLALAGGFALALLPWLLASGDALEHMLRQSLLRSSAEPAERFALHPNLGLGFDANPLARIPAHWIVSLVHNIHSVGGTSHFLSNPVQDPVSASLAWVGIWLACRGLHRDWRNRFLVASLLLSALLVGALSPYGYPPLTRLFFLAPLYAIFAAVALDRGRLGWLRNPHRRAAPAAAVCVWLVLLSAGANLFAIQRSIRIHFHGFGDGSVAELIRVAQSMPPETQFVFVQRELTSADLPDAWFDAYGMADRFSYFGGRDKRIPRASIRPLESLPVLLSIQPPFAVFSDLDDPEVNRRIRLVLAARFPAASWRETDEGKPWSVPYFFVPAP